jgi:hypothetical protein
VGPAVHFLRLGSLHIVNCEQDPPLPHGGTDLMEPRHE